MYSEQINIDSPNQEEQQIYQVLQQEQLGTKSTVPVQLNDFYLLVSDTQVNKQFKNQQQWQQLLGKKFVQRQSSMNLTGLNSILNLKQSQVQRRQKIWMTLIKQAENQDDSDQQYEQPSQKTSKQIQFNINKMLNKISLTNEMKKDELKLIFNQIISVYEAKQKHLGFVKGLQYICYGIYQALPTKDFQLVNLGFQYFMNILNLKEIFYSASPLFYTQLAILRQQLQAEASNLYKVLQENKVDWGKLFIAYYRTLLLNKLRNRKVIIKIFDLILIYGICIVRMILVRILSKNQQKLLLQKDPEQLMKLLGTKLLYYQFEQQLLKKSKQQSQLQEKNSNSQVKFNEDQYTVKMFRKLITGN